MGAKTSSGEVATSGEVGTRGIKPTGEGATSGFDIRAENTRCKNEVNPEDVLMDKSKQG